MQRPSSLLKLKKIYERIMISCPQIQNPQNPFQVFLSHRGVDTKRNLAVLLHNKLMKQKIHAFLDCKSMKPGDRLFETINSTISECRIGVILFSPRYCESYYCIYELALLVEMKKTLVPVFCNVDPNQLQITNYRKFYDSEDVARFSCALEEAKNTVGIHFNTSQGDWLQLLEDVSASVVENLSDINRSSKKK